jgi:hypothetical protein
MATAIIQELTVLIVFLRQITLQLWPVSWTKRPILVPQKLLWFAHSGSKEIVAKKLLDHPLGRYKKHCLL